MTGQNDWVALSQVYKRLVEIVESGATAEVLMVEVLRAGKVAVAADYYLNGIAHPDTKLHANNFRDARFVIWTESRVEYRVERSTEGAKGESHYHLGDFHRVRLHLPDVLKIWPDYNEQIINGTVSGVLPSSSPPQKGVGGAKGDYDWEAYLVEAAVHIYSSGLPKSQEDLFKYLWNRFGGKEGEPSLGSMKAHIGPLYRRFKAADDS